MHHWVYIYPHKCFNQWKKILTSRGVSGHFPSLLFASGLITRPGRWNFPLQLLSRAFPISIFSFQPPYPKQCAQILVWRKNYVIVNSQERVYWDLFETEMHRDIFPTSQRTLFHHSNNHISLQEPLLVRQTVEPRSLPNTSRPGYSMELTEPIYSRMGRCAQPCIE